jgi:hypothetical protein
MRTKLKNARIEKWGSKGSLIALTLAILFLIVANVRADVIFSLQTNQNWTVKYYGTFDTDYYGQVDNQTIINAINNGAAYETGPTRVYNTERDMQTLGTWSWAMDPDGAPWIGIRNGHSANDDLSDPSTWYSDTYNSWNLSGYYTFETTFTLGGNLSGMDFNVWSDNDLMGIYLTNSSGSVWDFNIVNPTAEGDYMSSALARSLNDADFAAGEYTLTFFLSNGFHPDNDAYTPGTALPGGWNLPHGPVGLRVESPMENVVPEPATLAIIALGLAGLGLARRRK